MSTYEPKVLAELAKTYQRLHDKLQPKGVNVWYGEAGADFKVIELIVEGNNMSVIEQYLIDNYAEEEEDY